MGKKQLKDTLQYLIDINISGAVNDIEFDEFIKCFEEYWPAITENTETYINFKDYDCSPTMLLSQLINLTMQLKNANMDYKIGAAITQSSFLFCIDTSDYYSIELFENFVKYNKSIVFENKNKEKCYWMQTLSYNDYAASLCILTNTVTVYNLLLEKLHDTSEYLPAFDPYDSFIYITSDRKLTTEYAEALADSFLFSLNSTLGLQFTRKIRPQLEVIEGDNIYKDCDSYEDYLAKKSDIEKDKIKEYNSKDYQLLPIVHGRGLHEVIKIFNKAIEVNNIDYKILNYARVIEYISPTVARKELIDNVLAELSLKDSKKINADFVLLLGENYKKFDTMKDKDLCRTAISVLNFNWIAKFAPKYIKQWGDWNNPNKQKEVVIRIADSITATRNEIAHAKANYHQCGLECPEKYKDEFAAMLQKIAELLIQWYSQQPEKTRICK